MSFGDLKNSKNLSVSFLTINYCLKHFYTAAYLTGLRCGEMLTLQWNIDPYIMELDIRVSHSYKGEFIVTKPKTRNGFHKYKPKIITAIRTLETTPKNYSNH